MTSCIGGGTLGGFAGVTFPTSKQRLVVAIDSLFSTYPEYKIPDKWKTEDDWSARGYDFLDSRFFYFKSKPEEMFYVSFFGDANDSIQVDTTKTSIAIRAVDNGKNYSWALEKDINSLEKKRMTQRFKDEIVSKLEHFTNTKATAEY